MIDVIDYRAGNAPSVVYALEHLGLACRLVTTPEEVAASERIVLPGVGAARATIDSLSEQGLVDALAPEWVIGVGTFAAGRAQAALGTGGPRIGRITHPSPANPRAARDWAGLAARELAALGLCDPETG